MHIATQLNNLCQSLVSMSVRPYVIMSLNKGLPYGQPTILANTRSSHVGGILHICPSISSFQFILLCCQLLDTLFCPLSLQRHSRKTSEFFSFSLPRGLEDHGLFNINLWNKRNFTVKFIGLILRDHSLWMSRQREKSKFKFPGIIQCPGMPERAGEMVGQHRNISSIKFIEVKFRSQALITLILLTGEVIGERWQAAYRSSKRANISQ